MSEANTGNPVKEGSEARDRTILGMDAQVAADFHRGVGKAISDAFKAYAEEVDAESIFGYGMAEGVVEGCATLFEELAKTTRVMLDDSRAARTRRDQRGSRRAPAPAPAIDYERLAQFVTA